MRVFSKRASASIPEIGKVQFWGNEPSAIWASIQLPLFVSQYLLALVTFLWCRSGAGLPGDSAFTEPLNGPFMAPLCQLECLSHSQRMESKHEANSWMWVSESSDRRGNGINGTFIKKEIRWVNGVCLWLINFSSCGLFTHRLVSLSPGSGWNSRPLKGLLATPLHKLCLSAHF